MIDGGRFAGHDLASGRTWTIEEVVADLDRWGVARALVGSYRSIYQDVIEGAQDAASWADRFPDRIEPVAYLHTSYYGDPPDRLLTRLHRIGIRVVAMMSAPFFAPVDWDAPVARAIGEAAVGAEMVLQAGVRSEAELGAVARAWGDIDTDVMIRWVGGHRYRAVASEVALAMQWPRVRFDVGTMASSGLIAWAASAIGVEQLFIASNAPFHIAACPYLALAEAALDKRSRTAISAGTIGAILPASAGASSFDGAPWAALARRPKVDVHWHPDHNNLGEPELAVDAQLAAFTRYGYERVIMSTARALYDDPSAGNAETARWIDLDPRIRGLIVVDPLRMSMSLEEIERYAQDRRFVGLKTIQDFYSMGLDDPAYDPILRRAAELGLPVMAHLAGMAGAAERHHQVTFLAAHANWGRAAELAPLRNVVFDFATGHALTSETQLSRFVRAVGADRVLFGSDAPLITPTWSLAKLLDAGLTDVEERAILRDNAYRVFARLRLE